VILAIDTSAGTTVAVVDRDRGVLAERTETDTRRHAEVIGTLIESALAGAGVVPSDLSAVVAGVGPGPYTGLRVGIVAARAFAFGIGRPCLAVASHDAIAFERLSTGEGGSGSVAVPSGALDAPIVVVTDARRREVAWTAYRGLDDDGLPVRIEGPTLARPVDLDDALGASSSSPRTDPDAAVSAAARGMLAERLFEHGREFAGPAPLYLREPDVTVSAGPKPVGR
jgi:tRNA threonylcarbamoyl adenosine modification protein YeaZ